MILIIDDDIGVRKSLKLLFKLNQFKSMTAETPREALELLGQHSFQLVILDMNFTVETSGEEGLKTLKTIKSRYPKLPVILLTGWGSMQLAVEGMKIGAADFLTKPWENEQILQSVRTSLQIAQHKPTTGSRQELDEKYHFKNIVGEDPKLIQALETVAQVARTDASVLILGESGTGKELIAEAIHYNSHRSERPFVKVNLGGISSSLFESEMFGHKRGAFTNAYTDRKGRFEMADKGTIFLDEIGEMDLNSQVKMLRVLQDRKFEILGSSESRTADVRVIAATNRDLHEMMRQGQFREDLFFRINLITVYLPALRERVEDIPLLADFFLEKLKHAYNRPGLYIHADAQQWLMEQPFYGNIRELKNLVESTVLMSKNDTLTIGDFQGRMATPSEEKAEEQLLTQKNMSLEEAEILMIKNALKENRYKITPAARALGISRNALYRRLEKYNISHEPEN